MDSSSNVTTNPPCAIPVIESHGQLNQNQQNNRILQSADLPKQRGDEASTYWAIH